MATSVHICRAWSLEFLSVSRTEVDMRLSQAGPDKVQRHNGDSEARFSVFGLRCRVHRLRFRVSGLGVHNPD